MRSTSQPEANFAAQKVPLTNLAARQLPTLSFILLTHATISHIGAFAYCCKNFPLFTQIPIFATIPVISLGRTLLQDIYASTPLAATFLPSSTGDTLSSSPTETFRSGVLRPAPTDEEITNYFAKVNPLKYSQPHSPVPSSFSAPLEGLVLTAYNAGHTVGGTIWHIQHGMESIVYAVDWNQSRENVIAGAAWFGGTGASGAEVIEQLRKPTALVCSSKGGDKLGFSGGRKKRDDLLVDNIRSSLAKGGTILIPTDSSARVLEIAYVLEHAWREAFTTAEGDRVLKGSKLYLASKNAIGTMRLARSLLEWMDEGIVREFEGEEANSTVRTHARSDSQQKVQNGKATKPAGQFEFNHLKMLERKGQVDKILHSEGPKVILASDSSIDWGFSKAALLEIAKKPENLIIMTERINSTNPAGTSPRSSMSRTLWQWFQARQDGVALESGQDGGQIEQVHTGGRELEVVQTSRARLEGNEQLLYQQYVATQRQLQTSLQSRNEETLETVNDVADEVSSSSSEESDSEQQGRALNVSAAIGHASRKDVGISDKDLGINILIRRKGVYDYDVRGKRGKERMFPFIQERKRGDEFGDYIKPEDFRRAEEREEADAQVTKSSDPRAETKLGQKRKWDEAADSRVNGRGSANGVNKRQQVSRIDDAEMNGVDGESADDEVSDEEVEVDSFEGPSKAVFHTTTISVNARLAFVEFTGLHDQRSLQLLIPLISPRKLILTGGTAGETAALALDCKDILALKEGESTEESVADIFTPNQGQVVDASVDTNAWMVKLSRSLVKALHWQSLRNLGIVALTGELKRDQPKEEASLPEGSKKKQKLMKQEEEAANTTSSTEATGKEVVPLLDVVPASVAGTTRSLTQPLHVGDLRLADLRRTLQAGGHTAEFRGEGTLLIDGMVAVRKLGTGRIEVESASNAQMGAMMSRYDGSFYAVKQEIYRGLAIVGGA